MIVAEALRQLLAIKQKDGDHMKLKVTIQTGPDSFQLVEVVAFTTMFTPRTTYVAVEYKPKE